MADGSIGFPFTRPLAVDLFAGGGGASLGLELAGVHVAVAVNHDEVAIRTHTANHPMTEHYHRSVYDVPPHRPGGRSVDLLWASPSCTHFSRARGGRPRDDQPRDLAWIVVDWARAVLPPLIMCENVSEWRTWGPLDDAGQPDASKSGESFNAFVAALEGLGYVVEWRELVSADYGAPTTRKRLFFVARRDGRPIVWPEPTHGPGRPSLWRTAAEIVDWSIPLPSVFDRPRELAEATQRRIAEGMRRFVFEDPHPYIVRIGHQSSDSGKVHPLSEPLRTKSEHLLCVPALVQTGYGEREGQRPRALDIRKPLGTVVAGGAKHAVIGAWLAKHYGGVTGHGLGRPLGTVTTVDHLPRAVLDFGRVWRERRAAQRVVAAFIVKYYGQGGQTSSLREPLHTIVTKARHGLVTVEIDGTERVLYDIGMRMLRSHELAAAQGFPRGYDLQGTEAERIRLVGNSVSPQIPKAIAGANLATLRRG